jgi:hypothetical protein
MFTPHNVASRIDCRNDTLDKMVKRHLRLADSGRKPARAKRSNRSHETYPLNDVHANHCFTVDHVLAPDGLPAC